MSRFAISFAAFCTAGQQRSESTTHCIEAARRWCQRNDYTLEQYPEREDTGIAALSGASIILGGLHLVRYRLERAYIVPGTVLILETLDGVPCEAHLSVVTLLMDLMKLGLAVVTLRDEKLWNPAVLADFGQFVMSVASMFGNGPDSSAAGAQAGNCLTGLSGQ